MTTKNPAIGTMKESSLHRSLKFEYSGWEGHTETLAGSYVCDGRTKKGELIEVQTGSFGPLKEKAKKLTIKNKLRIIHPIIAQKFIELYSVEGALLHKRKSPKKGSIWDLFNALIYAPELPLLKNLAIELAVVDVMEKRVDDGKGSWRRKGVSIADHAISARHGSVLLKSQKDYLKFIPFIKNEQFTVKEFGGKAGIGTDLARKTLYVLGKMGLVEKTGKQGRAFVYRRKPTALP
ncbi:MAG: hypothetical protein FWH35_06215 [Treponema sp.]|nr:hypothetical protein [Treponema sp.]